MKDIPLNAIVNCTDGYCGRSTSVIVDPDKLQVTYYAVKEDDPPHTERLVPVELARVEATDGQVGKVKGLVTGSKSAAITHFIMKSDARMSGQDVVVPLTALDHYDGETVYLKIDKKALSTMLAIPSQAGYGASNMEMVIVLLKAPDMAKAALAAIKQLPKKKGVRLFNVAVLSKDKDGKISVTETEDVNPRQGAVFGAITGGVIGLLGGPIGAIVGATAGAATARAAAKRIDMGFTDEYLAQFQESLQPGDSLLLILVERDGVDDVKAALANFTERVWRQMLTGDMLVQLTQAEEEGD